MNDDLDVFMRGTVVIAEGRIISVLQNGQPLPQESYNYDRVEVDGFVFPGLINSHNHLAFNVLPPWRVPLVGDEPLSSVYQWRGGPGVDLTVQGRYQENLPRPKSELMAMGMSAEVGKWAETRELISGTTTTQGSYGFQGVDGEEDHDGFGSHLVRNLDIDWDNTRQSAAGIYRGREGEVKEREVNEDLLISVLDDLEKNRLDSFLLHISEGTSQESVEEFYDLNRFGKLDADLCGPLMGKTAVIHGTAYSEKEFSLMASCGTKLIASPLSNLLYYGRFPDLSLAVNQGVITSLGTDWSPVGSNNLLEEVKVLDFLNNHLFETRLPDTEIVKMITRNPAISVGKQEQVGQISNGFWGDLMVVQNEIDDPYRSLIEAKERDVALVVVGGEPLYGDPDLMEILKPADYQLVDSGCGFVKGVDIATERRGVVRGKHGVEEVRSELEKAFRRSRTLRRFTLAPLFTCDNLQHFNALSDSKAISYYYPELGDLPGIIKRTFEER